MKNIKKQWFTLVELIVVITILAILWSIAFISLQGYSADARNSKRTSDLGSIQTSLTTKIANGQEIISFVNGTTNNIASLKLAWTGTTDLDYKAGPINYATLSMKQDEFVDPSSNSPYVMGITSKIGGKYEVASILEQAGWTKIARVVWTFISRWTATAKNISVASTGSTITLSGASNINYFYMWDTVVIGSINTTIKSISKDGLTIVVNTWSITPTATTMQLSLNEGTSLIKSATTIDGVVNEGLFLPY